MLWLVSVLTTVIPDVMNICLSSGLCVDSILRERNVNNSCLFVGSRRKVLPVLRKFGLTIYLSSYAFASLRPSGLFDVVRDICVPKHINSFRGLQSLHNVGNKDTTGVFIECADVGGWQEVHHSSTIKYFDIKCTRMIILSLLG